MTPSEKLLFAWKFLCRNPRYKTLWAQYSRELERSNKSFFTSKRSRTRGRTIQSEKISQNYHRQVLNEFGVTNLPNPDLPLSEAELKSLFRSVKPVGELVEGFSLSENRLNISIDPFAPQRDILEAVRELVATRQKGHGKSSRLKFPRKEDLETYLTILDNSQCFVKPNGKINWTEFANFLNKKLDRAEKMVDPHELQRTQYKQALKFRDQAPFSILKNYK